MDSPETVKKVKYKAYSFLIEALKSLQTTTWQRPVVRKSLFFSSLGFVVLFSFFSIVSLEIKLSDVNLWLIVFDVLILSPFAQLLSAIGVKLQARVLSKDLEITSALKACVIGTLGNILPIPAGMLAHGHALKGAGFTYLQSSLSAAGTAIIWVGLGLISIGSLLLNHFSTIYLKLFLAFSVLHIFFGLYLVTKNSEISFHVIRTVFGIFLLQLARLVLLALRVWIIFFALGEVVTTEGAFAIAGAAIAGLVISITPAGLGISETLAMGISTLINLIPGLSFVVVFLVRILGLMSATIVLSALIALVRNNSPKN